MEPKMIKKLKDAGVSADIILNLLLDDEEPAAASAAVPLEPEKKPEPEAKPEPAAAPAVDPILKAITDLTGVIQASNILRTGREAEKPVTANDVLAEILTGKKGE